MGSGPIQPAHGITRQQSRLRSATDQRHQRTASRTGTNDTGKLAEPTQANTPSAPAMLLVCVAVGEPIEPMKHGFSVVTVAIGPDGELLAVVDHDLSKATSGEAVQLWDSSSGRRVGRFQVDRAGTLDAMAFSPDGTMLALGGSDGVVTLFAESPRFTEWSPLALANGTPRPVFAGRLMLLD